MKTDEELQLIESSVRRAVQDGTISDILRGMNDDSIDALASAFSARNVGETEEIKKGVVLVIGGIACRENEIKGIIRRSGITNPFEFVLDYKKAKMFPYEKLRNNPKYIVVMVGPMPHKTTAVGDYSSVIAKMEQDEEFPTVIRIGNGGNLRITKTSFKQAIAATIESGKVDVR